LSLIRKIGTIVARQPYNYMVNSILKADENCSTGLMGYMPRGEGMRKGLFFEILPTPLPLPRGRGVTYSL